MSTAILRTSVARASKRALPTTTASVRAFHSPFAVLDSHHNSPSKSSSTAAASQVSPTHYEKNYDISDFASLNGQRTYVVSEPDANYKHYQVPAGAYPTSDPYVNFTATEAPQYNQSDMSSTAAGILAHPFTSRAARSSQLGDRNPQPDGPAAAKFSKAGVDNAWKMRI